MLCGWVATRCCWHADRGRQARGGRERERERPSSPAEEEESMRKRPRLYEPSGAHEEDAWTRFFRVRAAKLVQFSCLHIKGVDLELPGVHLNPVLLDLQALPQTAQCHSHTFRPTRNLESLRDVQKPVSDGRLVFSYSFWAQATKPQSFELEPVTEWR